MAKNAKVNILEAMSTIDFRKLEKHRLVVDIDKFTNDELMEIGKYFDISKSELVRVVLSCFCEYAIDVIHKTQEENGNGESVPEDEKK